MIKFGSDHIIVGYIKQLLHSFNLPMIDVYKKDTRLCLGSKYIRNNYIYKTEAKIVDNNTKVVLSENPVLLYPFDKRINNITNNFSNRSIVYDFETHKYLGKYLRFLKDYKKLNLMSLYNYFTNEYISNIDFTKKDNKLILSTEKTDDRYKYYLIPVVADTEYTIAIDCSLPYEICGMFYSKNYTSSSNLFLETMTYQKMAPSSFSKPVIYDNLIADKFTKLLTEEQFNEYYRLRDSLCIVLKVPTTCNSSIVILEGNHTADNDFKVNADCSFTPNYSITNYEGTTEEQFINIPLKSQSQLLYINSNISHPFADKLVGYLTGNTITNMTEIANDIKRIQKKLVEIQEEGNPELVKNGNIEIPYGIWRNVFRNMLYDYDRKVNSKTFVNNKDVLGYCDKDVEKDLSLFKSNGKDIKV